MKRKKYSRQIVYPASIGYLGNCHEPDIDLGIIV
jgi:hypothetical protein